MSYLNFLFFDLAILNLLIAAFRFFVSNTKGNGLAFEQVYDSQGDSVVHSVRSGERCGFCERDSDTSYYLGVYVFDADYVIFTLSSCLVD